jgi:hypothetical protein
VNFTREPIVETIITPKDGYKLLVRNSKGGGQEEYFVDAIEVVSFGHSFFFRSLERPKSFLVPVSDYEVIETKETRVALKNVPIERSIKIGGGREAPVRGHREPQEKDEEVEEFASSETVEEGSQEAPGEPRTDRKRDRRRHRRRRMDDRHEPRDWQDKPRSAGSEHSPSAQQESTSEQEPSSKEEQKQSAPSFSTLFPPPPTLISQTISRYKDMMGAGEGSAQQQPPVDEEKKEHRKTEKEDSEDDDVSGSDGTSLHRTLHSQESRDPLGYSSNISTRTSYSDTGFFQI